MLARSPEASPGVLASLTQRVPFPDQAARSADFCPVPGEDAPIWLAAAFAVAGTLMAVAAVSLWQQSAGVPLQPAAVTAPVARPSPIIRPSNQNGDRPIEPMQQDKKLPEPQQSVITSPVPPPVAAAVAPPPATPVDAPAAAPVLAPSMSQMPEQKAAPAECFQPLSIPFDHNSARPSPNDMRRSVEVLKHWLSRHSDAIVLVEGHSDPSGTEEYNVLLSFSRAKAVAALLKRDGLPPQQISIRAAGSGDAGSGAQGLARDRSAVLRIAGVQDCNRHQPATKGP